MINENYLRGHSCYPIPYLNIEQYSFNKDILPILDKKTVKRYKILPLDIFGNILTIAMANPMIETIKKLEKDTNKKVRIFRTEEHKILKLIPTLY